ncbi:MAG TPA: ABC transporter ATP-binding protein [Clostridiaceae bacterium]|nr:ABC transporter ATP-binding protein [Clostridiaceae bacterium]
MNRADRIKNGVCPQLAAEEKPVISGTLLSDKTGQAHIIELIGVNKSFGDIRVMQDITFYIRSNEFLTLLGPSGCGKTTTLRILGGFEQPDSGTVTFEGRDLLVIPAHQRELNTVFQRYALFPHLNVEENVAFGLQIKKIPPPEIKQRVSQMLRLVKLDGYETRSIDQLSGGQMQRVAIARALVNLPKVLLLDEPLGALDLKMRKEMQIELKQMQRELGITFVYVTHDQEEALTMSDSVIVMSEGIIQQIGSPLDIYNEPRNAFVADFIGESNIISGCMREDFRVRIGDKWFPCVDRRKADEEVDVVIRPEDIELVAPADHLINGRVASTTFKGVHYEMIVEAYGLEWQVHSTDHKAEGSDVGLNFGADDIHIMVKSAFSPENNNSEKIKSCKQREEGGE